MKLTIKSVGRVFKSEGKTFEEAVDKIKISGGARATGVIKLEKGGKEISRIISGKHMNGLFGGVSPTNKSIHLKSVKSRFGL